MARSLEVVFLDTGTVETYYTADDDRYVLADGSLEWLSTDIVWCNGCEEITQGERVEPLEKLDASLAEIAEAGDPKTQKGQEYRKANPNKKNRERQLAGYRARLLDRRRWLAERISPAKCLNCGTTDVLYLRVPEGVDTPVGKITLREGHGRATIHATSRYFSPEGDRIEYTPPPREVIVPKRQWWQLWRQ